MIASLPMYWRAENAAAWKALWTDVQVAAQGHGLDLPRLTAPEDIPQPWTDHWLRPDLVLSQTCSMPLRTALRGRVTYVGTFDFGLDGPAGSYHSAFVTRVPGRPIETLALNGYDSQSGYVAALEPLPGGGPETAHAKTAPRHLLTGGHRASVRAVADGRADGAFIDAVSHRLVARYDDAAGETRVAGRTVPTPGLPLITAHGVDPGPLRAVFRDVFAAAPGWIGAPELGGLRGFEVLDLDAYLSLPVPPSPPVSPAIVIARAPERCFDAAAKTPLQRPDAGASAVKWHDGAPSGMDKAPRIRLTFAG